MSDASTTDCLGGMPLAPETTDETADGSAEDVIEPDMEVAAAALVCVGAESSSMAEIRLLEADGVKDEPVGALQSEEEILGEEPHTAGCIWLLEVAIWCGFRTGYGARELCLQFFCRAASETSMLFFSVFLVSSKPASFSKSSEALPL